jgi:voltage-gated sodium channel
LLIKIRRSRWFSNLTTIIIIAYALILGFKTSDQIEHALGNWWFYLDLVVTLFFLFEILIKLLAEKKAFFKDKWNLFDATIILITLIPVSESDFAVVARLLRLFRIFRIFNARPELRRIIDMLINALPSIVDIVILMFIIFYIYAIVGSFLFESSESHLWDNLLTSMLTLFRILTFEDWTDVMYEAMEIHSLYWIYFVSFVIIAGFVFFNLFVAVIIGEMEDLREKDKAELKEREKEEYEQELKEIKLEIKEIRTILGQILQEHFKSEAKK